MKTMRAEYETALERVERRSAEREAVMTWRFIVLLGVAVSAAAGIGAAVAKLVS